jgi:hypothetical protein
LFLMSSNFVTGCAIYSLLFPFICNSDYNESYVKWNLDITGTCLKRKTFTVSIFWRPENPFLTTYIKRNLPATETLSLALPLWVGFTLLIENHIFVILNLLSWTKQFVKWKQCKYYAAVSVVGSIMKSCNFKQ